MVYLFLTDGFEMVEALTPIDILRRADIDVTSVSITKNIEVLSSSNVKVIADTLFERCDFDDLQTLILPGGPGVPSLIKHERLCELVKTSYDKHKLICAICAAPTLLTHVGIKVKTAVFPTLAEEVFDYYPAPICNDKNVLTANAMASSLDFALEVVKRIKGEEKASEIAKKVKKT